MYAEKITSTKAYSLEPYPVDTVLLVSYSNGGLAMITKWSASSYTLNIIHESANDIVPSIRTSDYKLLLTLGSGVASQICIIRLK